MNSRIKRFMDYKNMSSSELADSIGVQRSNVTHVLHGRNKPSFQFISKLLETYPEINAKWLIMGKGNMLEHEELNQQRLFEETSSSNKQEPVNVEDTSKSRNSLPESAVQPMLNKQPVDSGNSKDIEKIVVFYTDQTFKEYAPSK